MAADFGSVDTSNCTEVTAECPVSATLYGDYFSTGGCAFFVVAYVLLILCQMWFGWLSKTWSYTAYLFVGSLFELIGYISRLRMSFNPFISNAFIFQILFLILAPTLIAAAISLTFKHIVLYYGPEMSTIRPRLYPWVFVGSDFISIIIQSIGGAIAASASTGDNPDASKADLGNNLLLAGVAFQVVNMVVCGGLMLEYLRRIPEMASGWGSTIMRNEATFMIFDGAMILLAVLFLTAIHPRTFFPFLSVKPPGFVTPKKGSNSSPADIDLQQLELNQRGTKA
ncbi:hypothetical protein ACHAQA_005812 [Verticillium albo-atrum]